MRIEDDSLQYLQYTTHRQVKKAMNVECQMLGLTWLQCLTHTNEARVWANNAMRPIFCFKCNAGFDAGSQLTVSRLTGCETDTVSPQCTLAVLADCVVPGPGKGREGRDSGSSSGAAGYGRTTLLYITRHCSTIH